MGAKLPLAGMAAPGGQNGLPRLRLRSPFDPSRKSALVQERPGMLSCEQRGFEFQVCSVTSEQPITFAFQASLESGFSSDFSSIGSIMQKTAP